MMPRPLKLLYLDEDLVAIDKPAGLLVHRNAEIARHEREFALQRLRDQLGRRVYAVHRLDRATSGVLVFALDAGIAGTLGAAFATDAVDKRYLAVVRGHLPASGCIDHPLRDAHEPGEAALLEAVTEYRCLGTVEVPVPVRPYPTARYALVEARPRTGRTHQLRRHFKHIFHPILGDTTYGDGAHNRVMRERFECHRLLLMAARLDLRHPRTGERLTLRADPDAEFLAVLDGLGWMESLADWRALTG